MLEREMSRRSARQGARSSSLIFRGGKLSAPAHPGVKICDVVKNTGRDRLDEMRAATGYTKAFKCRRREAHVLSGFLGIEKLLHDNPLDRGPLMCEPVVQGMRETRRCP